MSEPLDIELGRQRIADLRSLAVHTEPGTVVLPNGVSLTLGTGAWNLPYVLLRGPELLAMLDRLGQPHEDI